MRYVFIINPAAGDGKAPLMLRPMIEAYFSEHPADYQILVTSVVRGGIELAKTEALAGGNVRIYACGGGGTLFDVINGAAGCNNVEIGIIPCGFANDFVRYYAQNTNFFDIEGQVKGSSVPVDLIECGKYFAINQCYIGLDSAAACNKNTLKNIHFMNGKLGYGMSIAAAVCKNSDNVLDITIDGAAVPQKNYSVVVAANAPFYGGGFKSAPGALPSDGLLDFVTVDHLSRYKIISLLKRFRDGQHTGLDACRYVKGKSMSVHASSDMTVSLDGEAIRARDITFKIKEKAVKIIIPSVRTSKTPDEAEADQANSRRISGAVPAMEKN